MGLKLCEDHGGTILGTDLPDDGSLAGVVASNVVARIGLVVQRDGDDLMFVGEHRVSRLSGYFKESTDRTALRLRILRPGETLVTT